MSSGFFANDTLFSLAPYVWRDDLEHWQDDEVVTRDELFFGCLDYDPMPRDMGIMFERVW